MDTISELAKRHDDAARVIWKHIPLVIQVVISPVLLPLYFLYCLIALTFFMIPWAGLDYIIKEKKEEE